MYLCERERRRGGGGEVNRVNRHGWREGKGREMSQ